MSAEGLEQLIAGTHGGALVALKRDGRPQISNVSHVFQPETRLLRISTTADRAKVANLRRDPRASYYVSSENQWSYAVAEGTVELTPVAADPHDAVVEELIEVYRLILGEHPDWDEYRAAMVADRRLVIRFTVDRVYGIAR
ncbi:PPOX class F420-dependent oxidoreductase [Streptacidiphilus sp. P02-A3a]|uniref:PPOX class F420-dependent oxidoreductase n=1 Tax=Streptacidiphilus sp. P02-A3a TaxID=2704468 RepID=UPI0015F91600|nr:PPOX class F420-dependent oxidoreductase [Streptacidiphilus sp. P02-A3a]QMU67996.1 PPOX class F420-dependent oxidoreductase [Streptacidiphilus sp. P02-A3a]